MAAVDLYWLPLGTGGHSVRLNGLVFEAIAARLQHRGRADLYHSALEVYVSEGRFVIEQAPAWGTSGERGVVAEGPVGIRSAGRFRLFGYEVRRWRDGVIPDVDSAVESPQRLSEDPERARRLLDLVPEMPTPSGAATNCAPARCGTRTPSSPGCLSGAASTCRRSTLRLADAHPDGMPESWSRNARYRRPTRDRRTPDNSSAARARLCSTWSREH